MSYHNSHNSNYNNYNNRGRRDRYGNPPRQVFDKPKREAIMDLSVYLDQEMNVQFIGGRTVTGILKGYDQLMNLVLDRVEEQLRPEDEAEFTTGAEAEAEEPKTRKLGLVVVRGVKVLAISPVEGSAEIANPFIQE